jgi:hypothetical protein
MLEIRLYPPPLNPAGRLGATKFRAGNRAGTDWRGMPLQVKPRFILVTHGHMSCEGGLQFGFKLNPSNPSDNASKQEGPLLPCVMILSNHGSSKT